MIETYPEHPPLNWTGFDMGYGCKGPVKTGPLLF